MTGFEVVVRPAVFPNIRPSPPRVLAPADNPEQGLVTLTGGGAKWISTSYTWSVSVSRSGSEQETKRKYDVDRVYQKEKDGAVNKDNFVEIERLIGLITKLDEAQKKYVFNHPPEVDNVETIRKDQVRGSSEDAKTFISGEGGSTE